ncbi:MAG: A/G-specific adenine glycosylase [Prevotella sp.]|nr:A/G-specific adenine glycosylase [Prevotella sp.]MBQ8487972.1 A/G-specific adenine glycosylase [Prevotella sp.]
MPSFPQTLLRWFRKNGRELPWRQTRDPYAIWLSEIILQQTQVKQGWAYWERFMRRWPTVGALAAATEDEVLREWQGLGYYSRARNLHTAARQIVAGGGFPTTVDGLRSLKGVGDYTAAAIASFAFDIPAAVVDGNVYRVLSRHYGISTPINTTEGKHEFALLAQSLFPSPQEGAGVGSQYNQAIMDFGATQCTPQSPDCTACPLMDTCTAFREGRVGQLPVKLKTLKVRERHLIYIYIRCQGCTAIHRRPAGDIWQGLYEPWLVEQPPRGAVLLRQNVKHVLTHRILYADFYLWETDIRPQLPADYFWIPEQDMDQYGVPRLIELLLDELWKK